MVIVQDTHNNGLILLEGEHIHLEYEPTTSATDLYTYLGTRYVSCRLNIEHLLFTEYMRIQRLWQRFKAEF